MLFCPCSGCARTLGPGHVTSHYPVRVQTQPEMADISQVTICELAFSCCVAVVLLTSQHAELMSVISGSGLTLGFFKKQDICKV